MKQTYIMMLAGSMALLLASCVKKNENTAAGTPAGKTFIYAVRSMYKGTDLTLGPSVLAGASLIQGVVISDKTGGNIDAGSFVLQETVPTGNQVGDPTNGIVIKLATGSAAYNAGDSLQVNVTGTTLSRINGVLIISGATTDKITKLAENRAPVIRPVTLALLNMQMEQYESTLVSVHADVADYTAGATYSGERKLSDNTGLPFYIRTRSEAAFAGAAVPVNAQFTGIAGYYNEGSKDTAGAKRTIGLRNSTDVKFASGALYAGFPESFESPDLALKSSYNMTNNNIDLGTGNWQLLQAILANTLIRDKFNLPGRQCIRMQQNLGSSAYLQMNFNVPNASKVTLFYGKYYTDPTCTFRLEYSTNNGTSWTPIGANVTDMPDRGYKQATFTMNIAVPVRFRINKLGLGTSSSTVFNGRLCIEDFAIYKN